MVNNMENLVSKCVPCICEYPLCNIIQYLNDDEKTVAYNLYYTPDTKDNEPESFFRRLYNIFTKKTFNFCFDTLFNKKDSLDITTFDPNVTIGNFGENSDEIFVINDIYYVNKSDLTKLDKFNYLYNGSMSLKLIRHMDLEGNIISDYTE